MRPERHIEEKSVEGKVFEHLVNLVINKFSVFKAVRTAEPISAAPCRSKVKLLRIRCLIGVFTLGFSVSLMLVFAIGCGALSGVLMDTFLTSEEARTVGRNTLLFQCLAMPLLPMNFMAGVTYQVVGSRVAAAFLSCSRQGLFYIPFIFILPTAFGTLGLECLQAASDVCAFLFALPFTFAFFRELKRLDREEGVKDNP